MATNTNDENIQFFEITPHRSFTESFDPVGQVPIPGLSPLTAHVFPANEKLSFSTI